MLKPGIYPIQMENEGIRFQIGRKKFAILLTRLMNCGHPINCLHDLSQNGQIHPLTNITGNRFKMGKYGEIEVIINFNHVKIQ